jgi:hypothetical protein
VLVVLNAEEEYIKKHDPESGSCRYDEDEDEWSCSHQMWKITFGVDLPSGDGARIDHWVPESFPPKLINMQEVLLSEYEDEEAEYKAKPKAIMFKVCAGLIEEDEEFERTDGKPSWKVMKLAKLKTAQAEGLLSPDAVAAAQTADEGDNMF